MNAAWMAAVALVPIAAALGAENPGDPGARLTRARAMVLERADRLPDYTCVQTVDRRYYTRRKKDRDLTCEQIRALEQKGLVLESTDRLRLELKVSHGQEIGSWAGSQFTEQSIFDLIGGGPYGTGMLGALVGDVFVNGGAAYGFVGDDAATGVSLAAYTYNVPLAASHYHVKTRTGWAPTPFHGAFWLDSKSLELKRIIVEAPGLPLDTGACDAATGVDYKKVKVGDGDFLLPARSTMRMVMRDGAETDSTAVYSGCHQYRGEATIRFDDDAPVEDWSQTAQAPAAPIPAGLQFTLALAEAIDTDTAAAGDVVRASIRGPVRDARSKELVMPSGARVQGRIIQMQHWLGKPRKFTIAVLLEKVEVGGVWRPLYAEIRQRSLEVSRAGQSERVAALVFESRKDEYQVPVGYLSHWVTVSPS